MRRNAQQEERQLEDARRALGGIEAAARKAYAEDIAAAVRAEVDAVCGDRAPTMEDCRALALTTRVINEVRPSFALRCAAPSLQRPGAE
jgi:hypothetical protein